MQALLKISSTLKPCAIWRNKRWWRKSVFSSAVNLRLSILVKNQRVHLGAILYSQHLFKTLVNDNVWKLIHQSLKSRFKNRFSAGQIKCRHLTMTNTNYGGLANELELKTDFWRTVFYSEAVLSCTVWSRLHDHSLSHGVIHSTITSRIQKAVTDLLISCLSFSTSSSTISCTVGLFSGLAFNAANISAEFLLASTRLRKNESFCWKNVIIHEDVT